MCVYAGRHDFSLVRRRLELRVFISLHVLGVDADIIELVDVVDDDRCRVLG